MSVSSQSALWTAMNVNKVLANTGGIYSALQIKNIFPACLVKRTTTKNPDKLQSG